MCLLKICFHVTPLPLVVRNYLELGTPVTLSCRAKTKNASSPTCERNSPHSNSLKVAHQGSYVPPNQYHQIGRTLCSPWKRKVIQPPGFFLRVTFVYRLHPSRLIPTRGGVAYFKHPPLRVKSTPMVDGGEYKTRERIHRAHG